MRETKDWKWGYVSTNGEMVIEPNFDGAGSFCEGLAAVKVDWARGYIDRSGQFAIEPKFEAAGNFQDGRAEVRLEGELVLIDRKGEVVGEVPGSSSTETGSGLNAEYELHDDRMRFVENEKFGYKDGHGNVVIKPQFFDACDFSEGLACVKKTKSGDWGFIDTGGKYVIPARFRQAKSFHEGLAAVLVSK